MKLLELLTKGSEDAPTFHIIAPLLLNSRFSDDMQKKGFGLKQYVKACHNLMPKLGYEEYGRF